MCVRVAYPLQYTEEKLGKAEQTPLDAHFENLLARADKTEEHTRRLLACMEGYLQPNPSKQIGAQPVHTPCTALRMEEFFYDKLELNKQPRLNNIEYLAQAMNDAGQEFGATTPYGRRRRSCARTHTRPPLQVRHC